MKEGDEVVKKTKIFLRRYDQIANIQAKVTKMLTSDRRTDGQTGNIIP